MKEISRLNKKDLAILQVLDQNVRASLTQIGKQTKLSKEVVQYRLKRLEEKNILTGFWATQTIGSEKAVYKLLLKNKSLGKEKKTEFIKFVKTLPEIIWFASTEGNWDFLITSFTQHSEEFAKTVLKIMKQFGKYFSQKHILKSTSMIGMNEKYLYKNKKIIIQENSFLEQPIQQDKTDLRIIQSLSKNARITFSELGRELKLTPEAISKRFKRILKEKRIQGMNIRLNHSKLGLSYYHIFIAINNYNKKETLCNYYKQHPHCVFIMNHIGFYDIHLEIVITEDKIESIIEELTEKFGETITNYELLRIRQEHIMMSVK